MPNTISLPVRAGTLAVRVDDVDASEWSSLLTGFADASIYQSRAYGSVHWGERQLSHLLLERDGKVVSLAQVRIVKLPVLQKGIAYIRWGPLCRPRGGAFDPQLLRDVTQALIKEYVERRGLLLRMIPPAFTDDPFAGEWRSVWHSLGLSVNDRLHTEHTQRVDLVPALEVLRGNLRQRWRNYLKSAEKSGFSVREGTSIEFYDQFLAAYKEMMARKRFETTVDVNEFRQVQMELPEPLRMRVFLCEQGGKLLNALVVAAAGDTGIYLLAATSGEGLNFKGAHLLQWRAIEWLKSQGFRWYDLGGINPEKNPGVFQFKNGLGGQDARQIGVFEHCGNPVSTLCVKTAEQAHRLFRKRLHVLQGRITSTNHQSA